jgi:tripartite ATP-independent transporter DctP family solute receptor
MAGQTCKGLGRAVGLGLLAVTVSLAFLAGDALAGAKVLKLGSIQTTTDPTHQGLMKFAELVAQRSQGRYEVRLFPASQLGTLQAQLDAVIMGAQEMFMIGWGGLGTQSKDFDISGFPILFRDQEHAWKFAVSPAGQEMYERLRAERSLRPLSIDWLWPPRQIVSRRPIRTAADMKGLKMRVSEQKVWSESWRAMGIYPTPMAWGEIFTGLQQGIVEALEGPSTQLIPMKFTDVAKNVTMTNHTKFIAHIMVGDKWFQSLSPQDQKMFVDASKEAGAYGNKLVQEADARFVEDLKKQGVNVLTPEPGFFDVLKDLPAKFEAEGLWSKGLYQKIQDVK